MKPLKALWKFGLSAALCAALTVTWPEQPAPPQTSDGLQLQKQTPQRLVYLRPAATFSQYRRVAILDCYVEFQKNWVRDYNASMADPEKRVSDADVKRMKDALAAEFKRVFTDELQKGGYQVTNAPAPDVLLLRPAIIDVQVTAPDIMSSGMDVNVITSAGSGTFYLELWDPSTNTILARVLDAQADQQPFARQANSITNRQAADIILTRWADDLVRHLDAVRGKT